MGAETEGCAGEAGEEDVLVWGDLGDEGAVHVAQ